ncbi:hypothetical protein Tco_0296570 [Tanacetum coccineum]
MAPLSPPYHAIVTSSTSVAATPPSQPPHHHHLHYHDSRLGKPPYHPTTTSKGCVWAVVKIRVKLGFISTPTGMRLDI